MHYAVNDEQFHRTEMQKYQKTNGGKWPQSSFPLPPPQKKMSQSTNIICACT